MGPESNGMSRFFQENQTWPYVSRPLNRLRYKSQMAAGIAQIFIGFVEIAFGFVVDVAKPNPNYYIPFRAPYLTGILYIISGALSVIASTNPKKLLVKGILGMNVVSAVVAAIGIVLFSFTVFRISHIFPCSGHIEILGERCRLYVVVFAIIVILLLFTIIEFLIAIITAWFWCASLFLDAYSQTPVAVFQDTAQGAPPALPTLAMENEAR